MREPRHAHRVIHLPMSRSQSPDRDVEEGRKWNPVVRFILSKDDTDKIATWKRDLVRILHVFNVR
jgi:hypothetical protein